jgi:uncharacterized protein YbjT (DUF2867 family)
MILVTGATGHTGQRLADQLVRDGHSVRILTRDAASVPARLSGRVEVVLGDLTDPSTCTGAFSGVKSVVACTHVRMANSIITLMELAGVKRGIFMSSTRRFTQFPEETARQVTSGEAIIRSSRLDWTIMRCSLIYGGAEDNNMERLLAILRKWPVHPLPGGGQMRWQPVFTWDVIAAIKVALVAKHSIRREYTLAGPEPLTYREIIETMLRHLHRRVWLIPVPIPLLMALAQTCAFFQEKPKIAPDMIRRLREDKVFDISDAQRDLRYAPTTFDEGIRMKVAGSA